MIAFLQQHYKEIIIGTVITICVGTTIYFIYNRENSIFPQSNTFNKGTQTYLEVPLTINTST